MRTTLKHVSEDTGLSIATVSRALRRKRRNYSSNEEKIYASARRLGYPFIGKDKHSGQLTIALVSELFGGEFYANFLHGFYKASKNTSSEVVIINLAKHSEDPIEYIISLSKKYSGICLFLPSLDNKDYLKIKDGVGQYPIVTLTPIKNPKIDTITFDSYAGGYMIAKHFEELGYKNFGFISGPKHPIMGTFKQPPIDAIFRKNGFLNHISENPSLQLVWTFDGDFSSSTGRVAFEDFSKRNLNDVAIFGCNDETCYGFIKGATENGYKVPEDFIIAGYDNLTFSEIITPELTSIYTDFFLLGSKAIKMIENLIENENDSVGNITMVPVKILKRKSTNIHTLD